MKLNLIKNWKRYSIILAISGGIFLLGLMTGMGLTNFKALEQIGVNTASGIIINAPWLIAIIAGMIAIAEGIKVGLKLIAEGIKTGARLIAEEMPNWLLRLDNIVVKKRVVENARSSKI